MTNHEIITQSRDIELINKYVPDQPINVNLRGLVTSIRDHGKIVFITLRDVTGVIQVIFRFSNLSKKAWKRVKSMEKRDRIEVMGTTGFTKKGTLSVIASNVKKLMSSQGFEESFIIDERDSRTLTSQFLLARLRDRARLLMEKEGYIEFIPHYLTSSIVSAHLEPLGVIFPGWGSNVHLTVSSSGQLLKALTAANTKVYCLSRIFSQMIRDGYTSAESMVLCAQCFEPNQNEMERFGEKLIKWIFSDFQTMPEFISEEWMQDDNNWVLSWGDILMETPAVLNVKYPLIQVCNDTQSKTQDEINTRANVSYFFRIIWPENIVLVEGHIGFVESIRVGGFMLHLERMIPLLRNVPLRFIRPADY